MIEILEKMNNLQYNTMVAIIAVKRLGCLSHRITPLSTSRPMDRLSIALRVYPGVGATPIDCSVHMLELRGSLFRTFQCRLG